MILTGKEIERCVRSGEIIIDPFQSEYCNPNSYNFHLGPKLLTYTESDPKWDDKEAPGVRFGTPWCLDTRTRNPTSEIVIPPEGIVLQPGKLYLGSTVEKIGSQKFAPIMAARSSLGRLGLFIFLNSGLGDIGFVGEWTLELFVIHPLRLRAGDRIGQMMFFQSVGELVQYTGKYQGSVGPQPSQIYKDRASSSIARRPTQLLLDAGGVLLSDGTAVDRLISTVAAQARSVDTGTVDDATVRAFWKNAVRESLWTGKISLDYALGMLNGRFGTSCKWEPQNIVPLPWAQEALNLVRNPYILSNHLADWLYPALRPLHNWHRDRVLVSDEISACKPNVAAYEAALERMRRVGRSIDPQDVLFVDNKADNLEAAARLGMHVLLADPVGEWVRKAHDILNK